MKKILYFAYGSNMFLPRIQFRLPNVKKVGTHKLYGWKLMFNVESFAGGSNYLNIVPATPEEFVEGVLYDVDEHGYKTLDGYEALYYKYYFDINADTLGCVYICTGKMHLATFYIPDWWYVNVCESGARDNGLIKTADYFASLLENINFDKKTRPRSFKNY